MRPSSVKGICFVISLFFALTFDVSAQQLPFISVTLPRHQTLDQRTIGVIYNGSLTGSASTGQFIVNVNGVAVTVTGVSTSETGTFGASVNFTGTTSVLAVKFDASAAPGHTALTPYLLPGEILTIAFTNTGSTLGSVTDGQPVADYSATSRNRYTPLATGVGDIIFSGQNLATGAVRDQCAPVNTNFQAFTYLYSLRFRNSALWNTDNNKLHVVWGNGADASDITGYLSNGAGDPGATSPANSLPGGNPGVFVSFRPGLDISSLPTINLVATATSGYYSYPDNSGLCNFSATFYPTGASPAYNSIGQAPLIQQSNFKFDSFDYDDANTGIVALDPTVLNSELVCLGTNVNMTFTDVSEFNCIGDGNNLAVPGEGAFSSPINDQPRWVRIIYGGLDSPLPQGNIRGIYVGADQVTDQVTGALLPAYETGTHPILPGNYSDMTPNGSPMARGYVSMAGGADANGVISLPSGAVVSSVVSDIISTISTSNHAIDQRFYVTLQYWNVCNPYPTSSPVEVSVDYISIIDKPVPAVAVDKNFCYNESMTTTPAGLPASCTTCFEVTAASVTGNTEIKWYSTLADASADANAIANDYGSQSRFLRPIETVYRASTASTVAGVDPAPAAGDTYSAWVRYRTGSAVPNNCLSDPVEVKIVKREQLTTPTSVTSSATFPICSNVTAVPFTVAPATGSTTLGGPWNYTWSTTGGGLTINPAGPTDVNMTLDITAATSGAKSARALRKYTTLTTDSKNCASSNQTMNFNVDLRPLGGTITGATTPICLGGSTGTMTLSGHSGNILRWEVDNGTGFNPIASTNGLATYSETPATPGTYTYRAVLGNGVCTNVNSLTQTVVVNARPTSATLDGTATICSPGSTNLTVTIVGGASPYTVVYNDGSGNTSVPGYVSGANISVSPTSSKTYSLVSVTDANGCTAITLSGTPTVTVSNPTSAVIDGDFNICPTQSANFNVVVTGGVSPYTLRYRINGGAPITVNNYVSGNPISTGALASGSYTYTIEDVSDQNTCLSLSNSGSAVIVAGSTPSAASFSGGGSVCKDLTHNLALTITGGVAPFTLLIDNGIGTINNYSSGAAIPVPTGAVGTITYNVTLITDACGSTLGVITNNGQAVTVNPLPVVANQTPTVCSDASGGNTATVDLTTQNALIHATGTITWFTGYNAGTKVFSGAIATPTAYTVTHNTAVFARVQDVNSCVSPATVTYTVQPKATITAHPGAAGICDLGTATFSVAATGTSVAIQWQEDADGAGAGGFSDISDGGIYSGATTNTLTLTGATLAMSGRFYRATVTSFSASIPSCSISSNQATLTVNAYPGISAQPSPAAQCVGLNTSFTATATGVAITRKWQRSPDGIAAYVDINDGAAGGGLTYAGTATNTLSLNGVTTAVNGSHYRLRVTRATSCEIFSNDAILTVNDLPTVNTITPVLCDEVPGGALIVGSVTLAAYDALVTNAVSVTWYDDAARSNVVTTPSITNGQTFYWRGTSGAPCTNVGQVTFTVEDLPDAIDKSFAFCEDGVNAGIASNIDLTLLEFGAAGITSGDGTAATRDVVWFSDAGYTTPIDNPVTVGFNEETDFSISATTNVYARVFNTSSAATSDCFDDAVVTLVFKPVPVNNPIAGDATLCSSPGVVKVYSVNASTNSYGAVHTYHWTIDGGADNFQVFVAGTGFITTNSYAITTPDNLIIVMFPNEGNFHFEVEETIDGCTGDINDYDVSVTGAPAPLALASPATQVCKDQSGVTYTLSTPALGGSTYTWTVIGGNIVGASSGAGLGTITVNWGSFTMPQPSVSVAETNGNGCVSPPVSYNITLNDVPSITSPNTALICSGTTPNTAVLNPFTANIGGVACTSCTFSWRIVNSTANVSSGGLQVPVFPSAGSTGTGNNVPLSLVNTSGVNGTVIFEVTAFENDSPPVPSCASTVQTFTVTVLPEPVVNTVSNIVVCSGDPVAAINFSGNAGGETFTWTNDNNTIGIGNGSTGAIGAFTAATNTTATDMVANITVTATKNGCTSAGANSKTFTITVQPEPVYGNGTPTVCSDDAVGLDLSTLKVGVGANATAFNIINIQTNGLTASAGAPATGNGLVSTVISDDRWTNTTANPVNVVYTIVPVTGSCPGDQFMVTVTVDPEPVYANATPIKCSDEVLGIDLLSLKAGTSVTATTFNITNLVSNGLVASGGSPAIANGVLANDLANDSWTNLTANPVNVVYTIVPLNGACQGTPFTVTATINPEPVYGNTNPTRCSDDLLGIDLSTLKVGAGVNATSYNIIAIANNGLTASAGSPAQTNGVGALEISNDSWRNTTANPVDVVYTIAPVSGTCVGAQFTVTVSVTPEPVYANETSTRCSYEVLGLNLNSLQTGGVSATTFNITNIATNGLTSLAGNPVQGNGLFNLEIADDVWRNATANPVNVVYSITPFNGTCAGTPFTVTMAITPDPVHNNATPTVCSDDAIGLDLSTLKLATSAAATTYNITNIAMNGLSASAGNPVIANAVGPNEIADDRWTNTGASPVNVIYTIAPVNGTCVGTPFTVTVTVTPEPVYNNATPTRCSDEVIGIDLSTLKNGAGVNASAFNIINILSNGLVASAGSPVPANGVGVLEIQNDAWTNTTALPVNVEYTIVPLNGTCEGTQFTVTVSVNPEPVYSNSSPTRCSDEVLNIDLTSLKTGLGVTASSFNITNIASNGLVASAGTPAIANGVTNLEISNDAWTNITASPVNVVYTIVPLNGTCPGTPFTVTVSISPEPVYNSTNPTVCSDEVLNLNLTTLKAGTSISATSFNITNIVDNGLVATAGNPSTANGVLATVLADDSWNNITANPVDVIYTIVPLNGSCAGTPFTVTMTVNPAPDYNGAGMTRCSDEVVNFDLATLKNGLGVTATGFNITNINSNGLVASAGSPATGINFGSLVLSDDSWTNTTANPVTVEYTIVPVAGTCQDTPLMVTVTITPEPVYANSTVTRCSDDLVNLNLSTLKNVSSVAATAFNIISITTNGLTSSGGSPAVITGVSATEITDDRWTNTTLSPVNVVYTIVPVNGGSCLGTPFTVTVAVNPEPVGSPTTFIKCNEEQFNLNLITVMSAASVLPSTFNITVNNGGLTFAGTSASQGVGKNANELFDDRWINTTSNPVNVTYDIIPISASNCAGELFTLTFTINPKPTSPPVTTDAICSDGTFNFDLQTVVNNTLGGGNSVQSVFRYTVTSNNPAVSPAAARNTPSDAVINDVYENKSNTNAVVTYLVTPISDLGCEGSTFEVKVTVRPEPVGINVTDSDCITNLNYNIQANHINVIGGNSLPSVFTYTVASSDALAVAPGPGRAAKSSINITDSYINTSGSDVTITYTITPFNAANPTCAGTPFTYAIVISSRPVGDPSTEAGVCSDVAFTIDPQDNINNGVLSTFSWTATYDLGLTGPASGSGVTITGTLTNNTAGIKNAYYEVTPTSGSCSGVSFTITQPINPEPVISATFTTPVCSDVASNILLAGIAGSSTPGNFDVTLVSRDADVTAASGNAIMTVGSSITNVPATALQLDRYTNSHRTIGLVVEYLVKPRGTVADGACIGNDLNIVVEVLPEPVMNPALSSVSICSDVANGIELDSDGVSITATNYFINSIKAQSTGTSIAPSTTVAHLTSPLGNSVADPSLVTGARPKGFIKNDKFTVTTADAANDNNTVVYNVTPRSGAGCYGDPFNVNLFVLPEPRFDPIAPPPVCSDATIDLQLIQRIPTSPLISQYNVTGITWQSGLLPGNSNIAIGTTLAADGSGNFIDVNDVYTNASAASLQATYLIKPIAAASLGHSCEGDVVSAPVTIRPSPQVLLDLDKIVCNEAVNGITIGTEVTSAPAQSFQIVRNVLPAGLAPGVFTMGTVVVNGASTNTIGADKLVNSTNNPLTATYTVRANTDPSGTGCYGPAEVISVTVEPQILVTLAPGNTNNAKPNICSTDDTQITLISPSNPSAGNVTFNFSAIGSASGISGMAPGSNLNENDIIEQALSNSSNSPIDVTYTVTPRANSAAGGNGCIGTPSTTIVKVEPKPKLTALPASRTICEGVPLGIDFTTSTVPSTGAASMFFKLTAVEDPNAIGPPASVSGFATTYPTNYTAGTDVLNDILVNSALEQQSIRYMFTPSFTIPSATCAGEPVAINVVVSPRPVMVPFTVDPKCSSETFALDFSSSVTEADPGSTLATWTYTYAPSGDPDLTGASNGAGYELSQVVFNKNAEPATVTYSIKAKAFGCESNVISVPVQVYPIPKITGVPRSVNVCDDALMTVPLSSTALDTKYTWVVDDELQADLSGASDQSTAVNGPLSYTVSNASTGLGNYTFEITPQIATTVPGKVCLGDPHTLIANVAPPLDGHITVRSTNTNQSFICQGTPEAIEFSLEGLLFFDVSYRAGSATVNLTRQSQHIAIPVNPASTTQYELISIKDGYGCVANINEIATVTVYPKPDASFNEGTVPPFVAGSAIVTYTNTSLPFNPTEFSYEWTFGDQSNPKEYSGSDGVIPVNYSLPGFKEVTLVATNKAAKANGVECSDTFRKTIEIILPPLIAAFQINPLAACFPVDLTVTSNTSTGDTYKWKVIDQSGNIAATALAPKPIFRIVNPGKYDVFLETSSSITGQKAFSQVNGIEVFDNPIASLEARPTTLFIPDTELTTFNFSTGANFYAWDFADGTTSEDFEPTHFYTLEGTYDITLVAGFDHGDRDVDGDGLFDGNVICYDTATRQVIAKEGGLTKVPNAFTPNKDGPTGGVPGNGTFNDTFLPITKGVAREDGSFIMQIFDRWGTLIFESRNQRMGWDGYDRKGNLVPAGVYVYKLDLRLADGQRTTQIGDVTVIR